MIINHLKNKIKKMSENLQFLHFVLKKIVSLQPVRESSGFAILSLPLKSDKFQMLFRKYNVCSRECGQDYLYNRYLSEPQRRVVSPRF